MSVETTAYKTDKECVDNSLVQQLQEVCTATNVPCDIHVTEVSSNEYRIVVRCIAAPPHPNDAQWVEVLKGVEAKCANCHLASDIDHYREGNDPIDGQPYAVWVMRLPDHNNPD